MKNPTQTDPDIDERLLGAGAVWRSKQVFERVDLAPGALSRRRSSAGFAPGAVTLAALGVVAVAAFALARPQLNGVGEVTGTAPASHPTTTALAGSTLSPSELEAAQLAVIEAVNADPVHFGGVYVDDAGGLVIQYLGANEGRDAIEQLIVSGLAVRWERVELGHSELVRIATEIADLGLNGVLEISVDTIDNQVDVTVGPTGSPSDVAELLESEYGDVVQVLTSDDVTIGH